MIEINLQMNWGWGLYRYLPNKVTGYPHTVEKCVNGQWEPCPNQSVASAIFKKSCHA
jgi:hypothetical protein